MANQIKVEAGGQHIFRDSTDYAPAAANNWEQTGIAATFVQIDCTSLADAAGRQSTVADLGATWAGAYSVDAAIEFAATPTAGDVVEVYWSGTPDSAGSPSPGNTSGSDSAYTGDGGGTLAESVKLMQFIGNFVCTDAATATVQNAHVGVFSPPHRYGNLVIKNESGAAFHSDMVETSFVFNPILDEVQD